jgi:DNA-binding NarL/FixJ family response regulator
VIEPVRVVIADDHAAYRASIRVLLSGSGDVEVIGEAADGVEALRLATTLHPDVMLMDLSMPTGSGLEATRRIAEAAPDVAVLVLTMHDEDHLIAAALRSGARGYALKGARRDELLREIRAVSQGEAVFGPSVARRLSGLVAGREATAFPGLTDREHQVLDLMSQGLDNTSIAQHLHLSPKTVRNLVSSVFLKLGVSSRAEAVARARDAGLGTQAESP